MEPFNLGSRARICIYRLGKKGAAVGPDEEAEIELLFPVGPEGGGVGPADPVAPCVERFGRRGTEPNELFRSEFGQNSFKNLIQEFSLENSKNSEKFNIF